MRVYSIFGFRSRWAIRTANISVILATLAAFAVIPGLERMLGFLGFLGLIGVATFVEIIYRKTIDLARSDERVP